MKYMQSGGFKFNKMMQMTIIASLLFFTGFWVTTALMYFSKMSLTPDSVVAYYLGSEASYTQARTYGSMLEVTHGHLPVMALVALLLTHLFIFTPFSDRTKIIAIVVFFCSALAGEAASWLVRFAHEGFAWLKIASFLALEISMAFVIFSLLQLLLKKPDPAKMPKHKKTQSSLEKLPQNQYVA